MTASSKMMIATNTKAMSWKFVVMKMPMGAGVAQGTTKEKPFIPTLSIKNLATLTLTQPAATKGMSM